MTEWNIEDEKIKQEIVNVLETCFDPEIPVNIYELGLIYRVDMDDSRNVTVEMTLTTPACPVAGILPVQVENRLKAVEGIRDAKVEVVWEPQWNPSMMSEAAKFELGML